MSETLTFPTAPIRQPWPIDKVCFALGSIKDGADDLHDAVRQVTTVDDALRLFHWAKAERERLDAVAVLALEAADKLCGGNQ